MYILTLYFTCIFRTLTCISVKNFFGWSMSTHPKGHSHPFSPLTLKKCIQVTPLSRLLILLRLMYFLYKRYPQVHSWAGGICSQDCRQQLIIFSFSNKRTHQVLCSSENGNLRGRSGIKTSYHQCIPHSVVFKDLIISGSYFRIIS